MWHGEITSTSVYLDRGAGREAWQVLLTFACVYCTVGPLV